MKIFLFSFKMAIKTAGSAQKIRVGRVSGNSAVFSFSLRGLSEMEESKDTSQLLGI